MARGNRVGVKGSNRRRIKQMDHDSEESDEEYKVTEDEDFDESDENYSFDGDEPEEILAEFEESKMVARSRNTRRSSLGRKGDEAIKPRKKRRVCYTIDEDDDDETEEEEEEVDEEDDARFLSLGSKANHITKPRETKRVSYKEVDEEEEVDEEDDAEFVSLGSKANHIKKPREKKRVSYKEVDEEEVGEEDDVEFVSLGSKANHIKKPREKKRVLYREVNDDDEEEADEEDDAESFGSKANHIKKPRERKRVSYREVNDDDEEEGDEEDDAEILSFGSKANNHINKPREKKRVSYGEVNDDDEEEEGDEEDDAELLSFGSKANNHIKKPREKKRASYREVSDDDEEEEEEEGDEEDDAELLYFGSKAYNHIKKPREKKKVSYREVDDEEEEVYAEFLSSGGNKNQRKKPQEKRILHTDEDEDAAATEDDDDEFMCSGRKANQEKRLREKRNVSYTEDDEDDSVGNHITEPREKRIVSYKEDDEEDEDEKDAEFKLSESEFFDDDDASPRMKKNEKVSRRRPLKKSVTRGQKKCKKSKIKKPTILKQRSHRFGQKPSSSKERPVTNKKQVETRNKKVLKKRKQKVTAPSDSDFVSSASSDHEYTISEEEREQMREASVYCANLRAKLRGKQEEPVCGQRKYPVRKGKEKVEDMKDELGKQVCGICLSEEGKRTVRGVLNCCRHHFCFSCIMEWSKVESRCPVCKQRFATITKAAKSDTGFDLRTVVIPVPECDQVYQPSEEELRGYLDPYASVICTECHSGGEDALMLLCDICDSPAHTFCVGLGREVPEGNWYCEGCRPTVFGSLNSQRLTPTSDRRLSSNASDQSSPIAGGFDLNELYVPETPLVQQTRFLPEHRLPIGDCMPAPPGTVATTLRDRRRIHRQIHHRFLNNNRTSDLVFRSSGTSSSSGIRLFGSQLDQARDSTPQRAAHHHELFNGREDQVMHSLHDNTNLFSTRPDQFSVRVQNSNLASVDVSLQAENDESGMTFDSRLEYAQLHPRNTNRSSIGSDASPSPYACREVIGPSRTSRGSLHTPY